MNKSHIVLLVLTQLFVSQVTSEPPTDGGKEDKLEDNMCKRKEFIEKGELTECLQKLKPNMNVESILDVLGKSVNKALKLCYEKRLPFDVIEVRSGRSYISGRSGIMNIPPLFVENQNYLGAKALDENGNGVLEFKVSYEYLKESYVIYNNVQVNLPVTYNLLGDLYVKFKGFKIDLTLSTTSIMEKLKNKECFLQIKSVDVLLDGPDSMYFMDHKKTYKFRKDTVDHLISTKVDYTKNILINKIKTGFYAGLVNSGGWVCLDDHVKEMIDKKLTSTGETVTN